MTKTAAHEDMQRALTSVKGTITVALKAIPPLLAECDAQTENLTIARSVPKTRTAQLGQHFDVRAADQPVGKRSQETGGKPSVKPAERGRDATQSQTPELTSTDPVQDAAASQAALTKAQEKIKSEFQKIEARFASLIEKAETRAAEVQRGLSDIASSPTDSQMVDHSGLFITAPDPARNRLFSSDKWQVAFSSIGLKDSLQSFLDHLSTRRIAEEMDTTTYQQRMRDAMDRAKRRSERLRVNQIGAVLTELEAFEHAAKELVSESRAQLKRADWPSFQRRSHQIERLFDQFEKTITTEISLRKKCYAAAQKRLSLLETHTLSPDAYMRLEGISGMVSDEIAKQPFFRWIPALTAGGAAILSFYLLGRFHFPYVIVNTLTILTGVFSIFYFLSVLIGKRYRSSIMKDARACVAQQIERILPSDASQTQSLMFSKTPHKAFISVPKHRLPRVQPHWIKGEAVLLMFAKNVMIMIIPILLLLTFRPADASLTFVSKQASGTFCELGKGRIVFSDKNRFFINPTTPQQIWDKTSLFRPLDQTTLVYRANIDRVYQTSPEPAVALKGCGEATISEEPPVAGDDQVAQLIEAMSAGKKELLQKIANRPISDETLIDTTANIEQQQQEHAELLAQLTQSQKTEANALKDLATSVSKVATSVLATPPVTQHFFVVTEHGSKTKEPPTVTNQNPETATGEKTAKTLVLPFFKVPVRKTNNKLEGAFEVGKASLGNASLLGDRNSSDADYLARFVESVKLQARNDSEQTIVLDVMGFASDFWDVPPVGSKTFSNELNHALAEGRRFAVLSALKTAMGETANSIGIVSPAKEGGGVTMICLSEWTGTGDWRSQARFLGFPQMREKLGQTFLNVRENEVMDNFWARSVVVSMRLKPGGCG